MKQVLGIRKTTCEEVCVAELGYPSIPLNVHSSSHPGQTGQVCHTTGRADDPLAHVTHITLSNACHTSRYITDLINSEKDDVHIAMEEIKDRISTSVKKN